MKKTITVILCLLFITTYVNAYEIEDFLEMLKNWVDLDTLINDNNTSSTKWDTSTYDSYYDDYQWNTHTNSADPDNSTDILQNGFSKELNDAYNFAHEYGITTQNSIYDANMYWWLTRIAMAKMLSEYAINVLWHTYNEDENCYFSDISYTLSQSYNYWDCKAYALWIMWQNLRNNQFRPYDKVTRAEFATALSRLLYNTPDWNDYYYSTHIKKLHENWIINDTNPNLLEARWYIMLMLMRATNN